MDKLKYIAKRLAMAAVTMLLITVVVFIVIQLSPGDFVDTLVAQMISEGERVTQVEIDNLRAMYGVDRPMVLQYLTWLGGILTGDWGTSFYFNQSVLVKIGETLGITLVLSLSTLAFIYLLSIPIAIYSAKHQYTAGDYLFTLIGFIGLALPNFLFAIILMYLSFRWTGKPIMGFPEVGVTDLASLLEWCKSLIIPIIVIGTGNTCSLIRTVRAQMLDEQQLPSGS